MLIIELIFKLYNVNFNEKFEDNKTKFIDIFKEPKKIDDILEFIFDNKNYVFSKATKDFILKFLEYSIDDDSFSYKKIIKKFEKELIKPEFKLLKNKEDEEESSRNNLIKEKENLGLKIKELQEELNNLKERKPLVEDLNSQPTTPNLHPHLQ